MIRLDRRPCAARTLLVALGLALLPRGVQGTTWLDVTATCPLCETEVTGSTPGSTFIPGVSPDFRPLGVGVDMASASVILCARCGFAAPRDRFEKPEGLDKPKVRTALAATKSPTLFRKLDHAIVVERHWTNNLHVVGRLALAAKWLADDTGEPEVIRERLAQAIEAHQALLKAGGLPAEDRVAITYLIGELHRQSGQREEAVRLLAEAEPNAPEGLAAMVQQQLFLARHEGEPPQAVLEAARKAPEGGKVAAIPLLRETDDKQAIAFLQDVCLRGPDELRGSAMEALVGREPKTYHLPIFLAGLRSPHFRTVQYSAWAVEQLEAREAAPIIVQALRSPVEHAEFRLREALAATATETEIDYLVAQLDEPRNRDMVFNALLSTRSPKAVPHLLRLLKGDPALAHPSEHKVLLRAAAFGPALLDKLPDLTAASADDPLAVFKAQVLGASKSPEAEQELLAGLARGGALALRAAIALALRGNDAGRDVLLKHLDSVHFPQILRPSDFDAVHREMEKDRAREAGHRAMALEDHRKTLQDPRAKESDKENARRELKQLEREEASFMGRWLVMLGATGNPKARPICLACLGSPSSYTRIEAAKGLAFVYDDAVGDALAERLKKEENEEARDEILRTFGRAGDKRQVEALVALVAEPTLVETKLAWIDTMMVIAPDRALPSLRRWRKSSNHELAAAAAKALASLGEKQAGREGP